MSIGKRRAPGTECRRGHPYVDGSFFVDKNGSRHCNVCRRDQTRERTGWTPPLTVEQRFWSKVEKTETCWLWTGGLWKEGYGQFYPTSNPPVVAHRFAYELLVGPVPEGLELDHLCRVRHCVKPGHLEAVTHSENMRRGAWAIRTHCKNGHEYTEQNTRWRQRGNSLHRVCRACARPTAHAFAHQHPEAAKVLGLLRPDRSDAS